MVAIQKSETITEQLSEVTEDLIKGTPSPFPTHKFQIFRFSPFEVIT